MPMDNSKAARFSRRNVANARKERTPKQQLKELDKRLGAGVGAARERARLEAKL